MLRKIALNFTAIVALIAIVSLSGCGSKSEQIQTALPENSNKQQQPTDIPSESDMLDEANVPDEILNRKNDSNQMDKMIYVYMVEVTEKDISFLWETPLKDFPNLEKEEQPSVTPDKSAVYFRLGKAMFIVAVANETMYIWNDAESGRHAYYDYYQMGDGPYTKLVRGLIESLGPN